MNLIEGLKNREQRPLARVISYIENNSAKKEEIIDEIFPLCGNAKIWGITGPPGSGKSTLVDKLIKQMRIKDETVAVVAVDPSSPFTGGSILGDRVRMQSHSTDDGVFIRSMASRGHLGGVSSATSDTIKVLDAAGFDNIIIETVGVGQSEIDIVELADVVMLVMVPGLGDEIQVLKAGVMEIGDIFIINKKENFGSDRVKAELEYNLSFKYADNPEEKSPIIMTSAKKNEGIDELINELTSFYGKIVTNGLLNKRRKEHLSVEITHLIREQIDLEIHTLLKENNLVEKWTDDLINKRISPYRLINNNFKKYFKGKVL